MLRNISLAFCCLLMVLSCKKTDLYAPSSQKKCIVLCTNPGTSLSFRLLNAIGQDLVSGPSPTIPLQDINLKAGSTNMNLQISPSQSNTSNGYIYTNIKPVVPSPGAFVQMRLIVLVNGQPQVYNLNIQTVYDECCGHHVLGMTVNNGTFIPNDKGAMDITIAAGPRPN